MNAANLNIAASPALVEWLKLSLPASQHTAKAKVIAPRTNANRVSWHADIIRNQPNQGEYTLIAIETYSQYILLLPFPFAPPLKTFEGVFRRRWMDDLIHLMLLSHHLEQRHVISVTNQFKQYCQTYHWQVDSGQPYKRQFNLAKESVRQYLQKNSLDSLDTDQARQLGFYLSRLQNRDTTANEKHFYPLARLVEDGLYRFAKGLAEQDFPNTQPGFFPSPHHQLFQPVNNENSNVITLANFRKNKPEPTE